MKKILIAFAITGISACSWKAGLNIPYAEYHFLDGVGVTQLLAPTPTPTPEVR